MSFTISMTGQEDYAQTIKLALCGYPGAGKTLYSSTAPSPFFIFFRDQPRIMSIADRYMPHTKVFNEYHEDGRLKTPVWDVLDEVVRYLGTERAEGFETVVVDTGDELFQAMKEGRTAQNRGKWAVQDWGWIADHYRARINRIIDLPKNVIVLYHLKSTQDGDEGAIHQELALQGMAKDEAAGWFDIVGVMDTIEETTPEGKKISNRAILTGATAKYPFAKDHSGKLPKIFEVSNNFVGDFARMSEIVLASRPSSLGQVLEQIELPPEEVPAAKTSAEIGVPTPDDIAAKKEAKRVEQPAVEPPVPPGPEPAAQAPSAEPPAQPVEAGVPDVGETVSEPVPDAPAEGAGSPDAGADAPEEPLSTQEAEDLVTKEFSATVVAATCNYEVDGTVCGLPLIKDKTDSAGNKVADENGEIVQVPDADLIELTMIRFRRHLCREHFQLMRKG